jgi:hypothetical protein
MTNIESTPVLIHQSLTKCFDYLKIAHNHQPLMPENVYNWSSTDDDCKFTIQNMAKLELHFAERDPAGRIVILPSADAPFALKIIWELSPKDESSCTAIMRIEAELNPFIKMIAVPALTKLVNHQANKLQEILA